MHLATNTADVGHGKAVVPQRLYHCHYYYYYYSVVVSAAPVRSILTPPTIGSLPIHSSVPLVRATSFWAAADAASFRVGCYEQHINRFCKKNENISSVAHSMQTKLCHCCFSTLYCTAASGMWQQRIIKQSHALRVTAAEVVAQTFRHYLHNYHRQQHHPSLVNNFPVQT